LQDSNHIPMAVFGLFKKPGESSFAFNLIKFVHFDLYILILLTNE
jgi:hypothetical protein